MAMSNSRHKNSKIIRIGIDNSDPIGVSIPNKYHGNKNNKKNRSGCIWFNSPYSVHTQKQLAKGILPDS